MPDVAVVEATRDQKPVLGRLMQLYLHDFSVLDGIELGPDGLYDYLYLKEDLYWSEPERHPFLIHADGQLAGFALVNAHSVVGSSGIRAIAEFFVVRKHRRTGIGRIAAETVFRRLPGTWEVAVMKENVDGAAFWRRVIAGFTGGRYREAPVNNDVWDGPVFSFASPPEA